MTLPLSKTAPLSKGSLTGMRICAHASVPALYIIGFGTFFIPGWLPPPSPDMAAEAVRSMLWDNSVVIRLGLVLSLLASPFLLCLPAVIVALMRRMEGEFHVFATVVLCCAVFPPILTGIPSLFWIAVAWREGVDLSLVQAFNDIGWFLVIGFVAPLIAQFIAIGLCIQIHNQRSVYPQWVAYFNYWIAVLSVPSLAVFFLKTGPLAWNGILAFWIPVSAYFSWWLVMYFTTLRAIRALSSETGVHHANHT